MVCSFDFDKVCFVIMPIGDQYDSSGNAIIEHKSDLKEKYDDLIKEAVLKADPSIKVVRIDDITSSGTISKDIINYIMYSKYVIADITSPNLNVFYELGLRHACKPGTIIIKNKESKEVPFDISHLRHISYDNTPSGLKKLAGELKRYFINIESQPSKPDSLFLEIAETNHYKYPSYNKTEENTLVNTFLNLLSNEGLISLIERNENGEDIKDSEILKVLMKKPESITPLLNLMLSGKNVLPDE